MPIPVFHTEQGETPGAVRPRSDSESRARRTERFWYFIAAAVLVVQAALVLEYPSRAPQGDEPWYLNLAHELVEKGTLPRIEKSRLEPAHFRPPGYGILLSPIVASSSDDRAARRSMAVVQFAAVSVAIVALMLVGRRIAGFHVGWLALAVAMPWGYEWVTAFYPDSFSLCFSAVGSALFLAVLSDPGGPRAVWYGSGGSLAAGLALLVRPENVVISGVTIAAAALLLRRALRERPRLIAAIVAPAMAAGILLVLYRALFLGDPGFVGRSYQDRWGGIVLFASTTFLDEKPFYEGLIYPLDQGALRWEDMPTIRFRSDAERASVQRLVVASSSSGYTRSVDAEFRDLALARIRERPLGHFVFTRAYGMFRSFVNNETSPQLLRALTRVPRTPRRILLGGFVALKVLLFGGFVIGLALLAFQWLRRGVGGTLESAVLLLVVPLVARAGLVCLVIGLREHRYMAAAWPPLLLVVAMMTARAVPGPGREIVVARSELR